MDHMKLKFLLLTFLLLFARGCDFYSTSLWFFDTPTDETNPLARFFGLGWTGLVITNVLLIGFIIYAFYYYTFRYATPRLSSRPDKLTDFVSDLYFNEKGKFYQIWYKVPKNRNIWMGHAGYVLIRVLIIASFLATIHNLCQYYELAAYQTFREMVKRPLFVIYGLILFSVVYFYYRIWSLEYEGSRKDFSLEKQEE